MDLGSVGPWDLFFIWLTSPTEITMNEVIVCDNIKISILITFNKTLLSLFNFPSPRRANQNRKTTLILRRQSPRLTASSHSALQD